MKPSLSEIATGAVLWLLPLAAGYAETVVPAIGNGARTQQFAKIIPGHSTKADVKALLGTPWREVEFNDCGIPMDEQGDETWEYRGRDGNDGYRLHIEFSDSGVVHLIGKIPDRAPGGAATSVKVAPPQSSAGMAM